MFTPWQRAAVAKVFESAHYDGPLQVLPDQHSTEVCFILDQVDLLAISDVLGVERRLEEVLETKVWVLASIEENTVPFA